ncbi:MAG TPA: hypothetical protein DEF05_01400 [Erwinia sp.]|uniref:hypothetical protein n=1 Tax=Erwinia citreus TaxID=558 RepID=UPI000E8B35D5|nr:hypothetical protein [Erwinia sp.]HBV38365.1 hypothetical protein [Erwinia sp.]
MSYSARDEGAWRTLARITSQMPIAEIAITDAICQDCGSSNGAQCNSLSGCNGLCWQMQGKHRFFRPGYFQLLK